jgi:hypothetical protein
MAVLQVFRKRICSFFGEHVRFVDDIDLIRRGKWCSAHCFAKVADLVDAAIRCCVYLDDIFIVASDISSYDASNCRLPCSSSSAEKICVEDFLLLNGMKLEVLLRVLARQHL